MAAFASFLLRLTAMTIAAGLLITGAVVNWVGIKDPGGPPWIRHPRRDPGAVLPRQGAEAGAQTAAPPAGRWRPRWPAQRAGRGT